MATTDPQPQTKTLAQRLAEIHVDAKPAAKAKAAPAKKEEEKKPQTLAQKISAINTAKYTSDKEAAMANENSKLKQQIASAKSKRGPSAASRVSGLQKLQPNLGKQFNKPGDLSSLLD